MVSTSISSFLRRDRPKCDFTSVTEQPGIATTRESSSMLRSRYSLAADASEGKEVLEIACGAGMGLGLLAKRAKRLVAGDVSQSLLRRAFEHYGKRAAFVQLDAHALPFRDGSFDLILCFEAIYYMREPLRFLRECRRVLRPAGSLLICSANPECPGFNRSPYSFRYFRADELRLILSESQFNPSIYGAFPFSAETFRDKLVEVIRRIAARFRLFPRSMKGKEFLKRLFYGQLVRIQNELRDLDEEPPLVLYPSTQPNCKILFAIARRC